MLFAGFNVSKGEYTLLAAVARRRRSANLVGSWIAYAVGYYGRVELLEKHGKQAPHQAVAPRVGRPLVRALRRRRRCSSARMLPIIRTFISLPAGVARMPFWRFTRPHPRRLHPVGVRCSTFIGKQAGDNWDDWKDNLHYVDYAVAALIVVGIVYLVVRRRRRRRPRRDARPSG